MGSIFKVPGYLVFAVGGIWGFFACMRIIYDELGFIGAFIALFIAPFTLYLAPFWAAFANGNWFPLTLVYGTTIVALSLIAIGSVIDKD